MLTVDYDRLGVRSGDRMLDLGCGGGRHAFESVRRGCQVAALDLLMDDLREVKSLLDLTALEVAEKDGTKPLSAGSAIAADANALPFPDDSFDRIVAAEVLEHIYDDLAAMKELARVLRPGGTIAVSVPAWLAERVCWALSQEYHAPAVEGGHVRIYTAAELKAKLATVGLTPLPKLTHGAHALHAPYWWLRCAVGLDHDKHRLVRAYQLLLSWDWLHKPVLTQTLERWLNPLLPKSIVIYAQKTDRQAHL